MRRVRRSLVVVLVAAMIGGVTLIRPGSAHASGSSTVSGTMFNDSNRNGVQDSGEPGFANETLYLMDSTGTWVASAVTDSSGNFQFSGLADGTYSVEADSSTWMSLRDSWVPDNSGSLYMKWTVNVSGSATVGLALRQIVRSTTTTPISSVTTANGTVINSFDDVVSATTLAGALANGQLIGAEAPFTTIEFDSSWNTSDVTVVNVGGSQGNYSGYSATVYVAYDPWLDHYDYALFYEYGHAWSLYYAYIVQQDSTLTSYLQARGLYGNPMLGSSLVWEPTELIADDYRQLFGSSTAASVPQDNTDIPPASQVAGLKQFLSTTFMTPPTSPSSSSSSPPAAPTGLTATAGNGNVSLSWSASSGAASYAVLRCVGAGCVPNTVIASPTSTSYSDSSVVNGTTYAYAVEATDSYGTSAPSSSVTATPQAPLSVANLVMSPSPVSKSGTASFMLSSSATVTLQILTSSGTVVTTLLSSAPETGGTISVVWNRTNSKGKKVPPGTYSLVANATSSASTSPVTDSTTFSCS